MENKYIRGSVWWVNFDTNYGSHIQSGHRPCLIVSNPYISPNSQVVTVCPLSTKLDDIETHVSTNLKKPGQVLCEQITTIDVKSIGDYVGYISEHSMKMVEDIFYNYFFASDDYYDYQYEHEHEMLKAQVELQLEKARLEYSQRHHLKLD